MANVRIGYYVHHQGTGHMRTALKIIPHIPYDVVLFSSAPRPSELPDNATFIQLEGDAVEAHSQPANSLLMYSPFSPNVLRRYRQILDTVQKYSIKTMYVDVSLEVTLFCKTLGLTVGHNVLLGNRDDTPHDLLFSVCDYYITDNAAELFSTSRKYGPKNLEYVGGISRFTTSKIAQSGQVANIVVSTSPECPIMSADNIMAAAQEYPNIEWHVIGPIKTDVIAPNVTIHGIVDDPEASYKQADLIVGAGGHNLIMEAAALGKSFVCIPEDRPYDEQVCAAQALAEHNMALHYNQWPEPREWADVFKKAGTLNLTAFQSLVDDNAAAKAAEIISRQL